MSRGVFVIAEAGVNHNGDLGLGKQLIDIAARAGAGAVKFQTFQAARLVTADAPKAAYQRQTTDPTQSQHEMLQRLELSPSDHEVLIDHAHGRGIDFLSTPFDTVSVDLLTQQFGLRTIKVGSGDVTNAPLLLAVARSADRVILSTGMSNLAEVEEALAALAFGFTAAAERSPNPTSFAQAFASAEGKAALRERVTLLHCTTEYPAPFGDVNLRAMTTLSEAFGVPVGYSDHTPGIHVALAAVARGARVIEKHVTVDRTLPGPDHAASLEPEELYRMVCQIRELEDALGDGRKHPTPSEWQNRDVARKSLVAARPILAGEAFTEDNLTCKRPGTGLSPTLYWSYLDRSASRAYATDEMIE